MSQHDYIISDAAGTPFLADLNLAIKALASNNEGATEPAVTYAHMWWPDTTADILKQRNAANTGWLNRYTLSTGALLGQGLGTPVSGNLANCTFPTLNQNTTGSAGSCTGNSNTATSAGEATNVTGSVDATGSIGYANGAGVGGSVTQTGTTTSDVTLNKLCGLIRVKAKTWTQFEINRFTWHNSLILPNDQIIISNRYQFLVSASYAGSGLIYVVMMSTETTDILQLQDLQFTIIRSTQN
jgi:hypothetical protein